MTKFFRPKEDITAYETAFLLAHLAVGAGRTLWNSDIQFEEHQWSQVPEPMRRHFTDSASST